MANKTKTAVIIGAGPAGLTAAYELLKNTDIVPLIIEKEDFVGGIARTAEHNGNRIDIGGHRFFSKNQTVMDLWKEIMPLQGSPSWDDLRTGREMPLSTGGPDPEKTDRVLLFRNRVSRIYYLRKFFDYPISMKPQTFINMGFARTMKAGFGYIGSCIHKRPENNLEDFMINRFGAPLYNMFFKNYTAKVWGRYPEDIGADWGAQRIKGLSLSKTIGNAFRKAFGRRDGNDKVETSLIESFYYPKLGPGQLWTVMKDEVEKMGAKLSMGTEVIGFDCDEGHIKGVRVKKDGETMSLPADYFISSMPVKDLVADLPPEAVCPPDVKIAAHDLPYRDFITVGILVNRLKIKNTSDIRTLNDLVPDCWIYVQEDDVKMGRIQIFNNWSPYMVKDPQHTVWIGLEYFCDEGDDMWCMSDADFIKMAGDELVSIGIIDSAEGILDSVRIKVQKAYPAYFGSYEHMDKIRAYLDSIDNLYCVGRNGQHRYNNMDHSMLTAIEAVKLISGEETDRSALWNVNAEKEYQEEKTEPAKE